MSTKTEEKPNEINPAFKRSVGSAISNPIPDDEYLKKEGNMKLKLILICIIIDFIIIEIMLLQDYDFLDGVEENLLMEYIIRVILCLFCFVSLIVLFCLHKLIATQIARWAYLILGAVYYGIIIVIRLINIIKKVSEDENLTLSIIFIILFAGTIAPRIIVFIISKKYIEKLDKLLQILQLEEQEKFVEKIATRIEKGYKRWSNPNMSYSEEEEVIGEGNKKFLFDKNENNDNEQLFAEDDDNTEKIEEIMSSNDDIDSHE